MVELDYRTWWEITAAAAEMLSVAASDLLQQREMRTDLLKPQRTQKWDGIGFTPSYITSLPLMGPLWDLIKKSMSSLMAAALLVFLCF